MKHFCTTLGAVALAFYDKRTFSPHAATWPGTAVKTPQPTKDIADGKRGADGLAKLTDPKAKIARDPDTGQQTSIESGALNIAKDKAVGPQDALVT